MPGPLPIYRPDFPPDFLAQAQALVRRRSVKYQLRQRATLALLLHQQPALSNPEAAARVQLHPNSVRTWRRRWAVGDFTLEDEPGRGRKADFSPAGSRHRQGHRL
jgi:transposase